MRAVAARGRSSFDAFRIVACVLVIANHTSPLLSFSETGNFVLTRILARVAVPYFLMLTGYFVYPAMRDGDWRRIGRSVKKLGVIYLIAVALYLPLNWYMGDFQSFEALPFARDLLLNGTVYHLWYLPAAMLGLLLAAVFIRKLGVRGAIPVALLLYAIGLGGDSYYGLAAAIPPLRIFYDGLLTVFDTTRNGLFLAPLFLVLGGAVRERGRWLPARISAPGACVALALMVTEGLLLRPTGTRHDSMYVMLPIVLLFLFHLLGRYNAGGNKAARDISLLAYLLHPWMIVLLRGASKAAGLERIFIDNSLVHFTAVTVLTLLGSWALHTLWERVRPRRAHDTGRAWAQIDLAAVAYNAKAFASLLPYGCEIMAVVKANAYGHGDVETARALSRSGVRAFAVATLAEGVRLRRHHVRGDILVLGYTDPRDAVCLSRYRLTATVLDLDHARALDSAGRRLRVHIKLDTGMHRLGVDAARLDELESIWMCRNLRIQGLFTHLCACDSPSPDDIAYTNIQLERFFACVKQLRERGYDTGALHVQTSYSALNYPELPCRYARIGVGLFGVLSDDSPTRHTLPLRPALSVHARVACVRHIGAGESVGYARQFTADRDMTVATIAIGYGDGIPRQLSGHGGHVLLHGQRTPIIGRLCMDQLCVDVSGVDGVRAGDVATLIGADGQDRIRVEELAAQCGTIGNDIVCRMGSRLPRIYV